MQSQVPQYPLDALGGLGVAKSGSPTVDDASPALPHEKEGYRP